MLRLVIRIDMTLTDERVLEVIQEKIGNQPGRMTIDEIARLVRCHPNTARRAVNRLKNANRLKYERGGGFFKASTFEVLERV